MSIDFTLPKLELKKNLKHDLPSGIAVFFVAIPLCLGIAHASGAPLIAGLISGIIGGIIVGLFSGSELSVTGPAAGLTAIVLSGIQTLGSYEVFLLATVLAGVFQLLFGIFKVGAFAGYIPGTVIKGMLSAIGLILIIKQFPHLIGYDIEEMGVEEFAVNQYDINEQYKGDKDTEENTLTVFFHAIKYLNKGVLMTGVISLACLILWDKVFQKKYRLIPGAMLVVLIGVAVSFIANQYIFIGQLDADHYVNIPRVNNIVDFIGSTSFPQWNMLFDLRVLKVAITIAIVASLETLLSTEAIDKIDPLKRKSNNNQELIAQGLGNVLAGLLGGIPVTAVIVRGSVNISAGGRTRLSSIIHGLLIVSAVMFLANIINFIPLASLAAILIYTGFKLLSPQIFKEEFKKGYSQFLPFILTVLAIVFSDLLIGVTLGLLSAIIILVVEDYKVTSIQVVDQGTKKRLILGQNITFFHRKEITRILESMPENSIVEIDGIRTQYIDNDVQEVIINFKNNAYRKNIEVIFGNINFMDGMEKKELKENMRKSYERLFENNMKWVNDKTLNDPEYFKKLSVGQTPQYLFIGCSDSRVPANEITGTDPGEMFVHRNIANMVVNTDMNMLSVVQYAVEVLNVKHIIVCGHYGCGGVKAAIEHKTHGLIDKWLRNIKDVYRLHKDELDNIGDSELRHRKLVEINVKEQVINLMKISFIQKNIHAYGFPEVHGWVYDISNGKLIDLEIDVMKELPDYKNIYEIETD